MHQQGLIVFRRELEKAIGGDTFARISITFLSKHMCNVKFKSTFHQKPKMIPGELVKEYVGHILDGVCPFAVKPNMAIYLDVSLKENDVVYPGAGNKNSIVELSIEELERYSAFKDWVDVCKE